MLDMKVFNKWNSFELLEFFVYKARLQALMTTEENV